MLNKPICMKRKKLLCIYPKDVSKITGRTVRSSRDLLYRLRKRLHKKRHQVISIDEFCEYIGLKPEEVLCEIQ
jgi:hypothetical protein